MFVKVAAITQAMNRLAWAKMRIERAQPILFSTRGFSTRLVINSALGGKQVTSPDEEFNKAWLVSLRIEVLHVELAKKEVKGRYGSARRKRSEEELVARMNYLTPPARYGAAHWQRRVITLVRRAQVELDGYDMDPLSFQELLDLVLVLPAIPDKETVARFLNRMGYHGSPGRPKKK